MPEKNRSGLKPLAVLALALVSVGAFATNGPDPLSVTVKDQNGNGVAAAQVVALFFSNGNPDPNATQIAVTNASGLATFSNGAGNGLTDSDQYMVVAASQGYLPNISQQFNQAPPNVIASANTPAVTITISPSGNLGEIDVPFTNVTSGAPLIFGQVGLQAGGGAVTYGVGAVSGGAGTVKFYSVASTGTANYYQVGLQDTAKNPPQFVSEGVAAAVGASPVNPGALNFAAAAPPVSNLSQTQQNGSGGNLSVSGVVVDTNNIPIPYVPLNFGGQYADQYGQTHNDWRGTQSDGNGNYQLYGLTANTSYYVSVFGSCSNSGANSGACYAGFQDGIGTFTANDFFFTGTAIAKNFQLNQIPPSTGKLAVYIKDQFGNIFPQAGLGLWPDQQPWSTQGGGQNCGAFQQNPGGASVNNIQATTGYALLSGLPSGNYMLNVWTPFGGTNFNQPQCQCNGGPCSGTCYMGPQSCTNNGGPQPLYRLTIDTTTTPNIKIYDVYGNKAPYMNGQTSISSVAVTVNISTSGTGVVQGTLTFPSQVDLSASPITITLFPSGNGGGPVQGGYKVLNSPNQPASTTYSIPVSSGHQYFMNIQTSYWGAVQHGGGEQLADLTQSTSAVINLQFQPAGRIVGTMRKPDGSAYVTPAGSTNGGGSNPSVIAEGNQAWGNAQINNDGSFTIGGLLPGVFSLNAANWGSASFPYTGQQPAPTITVVANKDVQQDMILANAVTVRPTVHPLNNPASVLPGVMLVSCATNQHGDCPGDGFDVFALPAGSPLNATNITTFLAHTNDNAAEFAFSPSAGQINGRCDGQVLTQPGFCTKAMPAQPNGTAYDFYLMRKGNFDQANLNQAARPFFVIEQSSKSVVVASSKVNDIYFTPNGGPTGSTTTVQDVDMTPASSLSGLQQAALSGAVTLSVNGLITQQQFQNLGGNFQKFLQYLPIVWVYDSTGTLRAAGMVVPSPLAEAPLNDQLQGAVSAGNYAAFQTLMGPAPAGWGPVGYQIRGLTAGQTYSIVATTPNYPPVKKTVTLGVAESTTTLNIDFTLNAGVTLSGVVQDTNSVAIAGAQVTITAPGYGPTNLTTDASGSWSVGGLSAGQYQILAVAPGFAQGKQTATVGSSNVNAGTLQLSQAVASISGTVYTNNPICPPGTICAAFGKTVLQGITVVAYDDTLSGLNPNAPLPLYKSVTGSSGTYTISGLQAGHAFTVFAAAPGYFIVSSVTTPSPTSAGLDFSLKPKPLSVDVYGSPVGSNYEFQIRNYKQFSSGKAYIGAVGFSTSPCTAGNGCTDASGFFQQKPDASGNTELVLDVTLSSLSSGVNYQLILIAQPNDPTAPSVVKIVNFGLGIPNNTCQSIDQTLLGDDSTNAQGVASNLAQIDASGSNSSGIQLPVGGVIPAISTAVPMLCMTQTTAGSGIGQINGSTAAFVSGVYTVVLSSVNYNKGIDLTLSYNQNGADLGDMAICAYSTATGKYQPITGVTQTIDPVRGTISISGLKNLASIASLGVGGLGAHAEAAGRFTALFDGHQHRVNPLAAGGSDTASFAILRPSVVGGSFKGTDVKIYNFPNPFNLTTKSVPTNQTASNVCSAPPATVATNGTVIKVESPAGVSGQAAIRIYTLSGRLVRELDGGVLSGSGQCLYVPWDGLNRNGQQVADGVYYGIFTVGGDKSGGSHGIFKMAVVK